ncbi:hypothetical protein D9M70_552600 [compost metagenome]
MVSFQFTGRRMSCGSKTTCWSMAKLSKSARICSPKNASRSSAGPGVCRAQTAPKRSATGTSVRFRQARSTPSKP